MSKDQTLTRKRKRYKLGQEQDQTLTRKRTNMSKDKN